MHGDAKFRKYLAPEVMNSAFSSRWLLTKLGMTSRCCQALIFVVFLFVPASFFEAGNIAEQLDHVFINLNITVEESKLIFANARESFQTLKEYQKEKDFGRRKEVLSALRTFTEKAIKVVGRKGSNIFEVFGNINSYLKGPVYMSGDPQLDMGTLSSMVQVVLTEAEKKLREHYAASHRNRYDIERIFFSHTSVENLFRKDSGIDAASIGYFFLETFATILGLSWGIISMIISGM